MKLNDDQKQLVADKTAEAIETLLQNYDEDLDKPREELILRLAEVCVWVDLGFVKVKVCVNI